MREFKKFLVPPDLQQKFLIFRMTIPEFCVVVVLVFFAVKELTQGQRTYVILPCIPIVLFIRALDSGNNLFNVLLKRFRYYVLPQFYNIKAGEARVN